MRHFQDIFETRKRIFISDFSICMIVPLSDCNGTRTHNYLGRKRTLNHLAKWVGNMIRTYKQKNILRRRSEANKR